MIEGFLLGVLFTWPSFAIMCILAIIAESLGKTKTAVALVILSMIAVYTLTSVSLVTLGFVGGSYLIVGILWSFWRYKRFVQDKYQDAVDSIPGYYSPGAENNKILTVKRETAPDKVVDKILSWIVIWPLSIISEFLGGTVYYLKALVQKQLKEVYARIHSRAFRSL